MVVIKKNNSIQYIAFIYEVIPRIVGWEVTHPQVKQGVVKLEFSAVF